MKSTRECPAHELLIDLAYEELTPPEATGLLAHLEACPKCSLEYTQVLRFLKLANGLQGGLVKPSPLVWEKLRAVVERQTTPWRQGWRRLCQTVTFPIPAYQALLLGAALALTVQMFTAPSGPPPPRVASQPHPRGHKDEIRRIEPATMPMAPIPRDALRFSDEAVHVTVAEVF